MKKILLLMLILGFINSCHLKEDTTDQNISGNQGLQTNATMHSLTNIIEKHGQNYFSQGIDTCYQCHNNGVNKKTSMAKSCKSCHASFPHKPLWRDNHGVAFHDSPETNSKNNVSCVQCHNKAMPQKEKITSMKCSSCHIQPVSPDQMHTDAFYASTVNHAKAYLEDKSACLTCHSSQKAETKSINDPRNTNGWAPNCKSCHNNFPHVKGFLPKHGNAFLSRTKEDFSCKECHNQHMPKDLKIKNLQCSTCHLEPMQPDQIHPDSWTDSESTNHHKNEIYNGKGVQTCNVCHKNDLTIEKIKNGGLKTANDCKTCHEWDD